MLEIPAVIDGNEGALFFKGIPRGTACCPYCGEFAPMLYQGRTAMAVLCQSCGAGGPQILREEAHDVIRRFFSELRQVSQIGSQVREPLADEDLPDEPIASGFAAFVAWAYRIAPSPKVWSPPQDGGDPGE